MTYEGETVVIADKVLFAGYLVADLRTDVPATVRDKFRRMVESLNRGIRDCDA